jgi:hypothetical protein
MEPAVRVWWLMAAAVLVMVLAFAADRLWSRHLENRLIATGVPTEGKVLSSGQHATPGQTADPGDPVAVGIQWHGQPMRLSGSLATQSFIGATIQLHVDPHDPTLWTDQTTATPIARSLFVGFLALPIVLLLVAVAAVRARGVGRTWETGSAVAAVVHDRRQTPLAPMTYAVRCSLRDGGDRRLFTVHVPRGGTSLGKGDEIDIVRPTGRGRPVAVRWFDQDA